MIGAEPRPEVRRAALERADTSRGRFSGLGAAAAVALLAVGCAEAGPAAPVSSPPPDTPDVPTDPPPPPPFTGIAGRLAFVSTRDGSPWIYVADSTIRRLVPGDEPSWSPDGTTLAFESREGISLVGADGAGARLIRPWGFQPEWSPDGTHIVFRDRGIRVMRSDGTGERLLVRDDFLRPSDELWSPDWSPDGKLVAFVRYDCCWIEPSEVFAAGVDGTPPRPVLGQQIGRVLLQTSHHSPAWSPDGRSIAIVYDHLLVTADAATGAVEWVGSSASSVDWSPDGRHLVFSDDGAARGALNPPLRGGLRIYAAELATGGVRRLIPDAVSPVNTLYWDDRAVWTPVGPRR